MKATKTATKTKKAASKAKQIVKRPVKTTDKRKSSALRADKRKQPVAVKRESKPIEYFEYFDKPELESIAKHCKAIMSTYGTDKAGLPGLFWSALCAYPEFALALPRNQGSRDATLKMILQGARMEKLVKQIKGKSFEDSVIFCHEE